MKRKVPALIKSRVLPTVIYCWNCGSKKPDLNQPHWEIYIDSNPYKIYCEYQEQFARFNHGFTYAEAEEWLFGVMAKL